MFTGLGLWVGALIRLFRSGRNLALENLALRQQLAALKRRHPRPRLDFLDKLENLCGAFYTITFVFKNATGNVAILCVDEILATDTVGSIDVAPNQMNPWWTKLTQHCCYSTIQP
jgi:hypothetical protein